MNEVQNTYGKFFSMHMEKFARLSDAGDATGNSRGARCSLNSTTQEIPTCIQGGVFSGLGMNCGRLFVPQGI